MNIFIATEPFLRKPHESKDFIHYYQIIEPKDILVIYKSGNFFDFSDYGDALDMLYKGHL